MRTFTLGSRSRGIMTNTTLMHPITTLAQVKDIHLVEAGNWAQNVSARQVLRTHVKSLKRHLVLLIVQ
jgi:polysaccharide deacetylase 2 family uncharacterized protein YibQ